MRRLLFTAVSVLLAAASLFLGFRYPCGPTALGALLFTSFAVELLLACVLDGLARLVKRGRTP